MKTLLFIKSSIFGDQGQSSQLAEHFMTQWKVANPEGDVVVRDLISSELPYLDANVMNAINGDIDSLSDDALKVRELADQLLSELQQADEILMAVPYYNFNIPAQIKSYFDLLARAGVTFKYSENGPVGLLDDKPVRLLATRGGRYHESGLDYQIPFVKQFLGFIGLTQVDVVYVEGLAMGDVAESALAAAREQLSAPLAAGG